MCILFFFSGIEERPVPIQGVFAIVVSNLSKNTCIKGSSRSQFEIKYTFCSEKKKILGKIKERERKFIAWIFQELLFHPLSPPLPHPKDLPSYEFESLRACLHREIYRPNYATIIRLINLPVYTSLNFKSSIVSECKPSEQLYFRPLNCACQLWADCLIL